MEKTTIQAFDFYKIGNTYYNIANRRSYNTVAMNTVCGKFSIVMRIKDLPNPITVEVPVPYVNA